MREARERRRKVDTVREGERERERERESASYDSHAVSRTLTSNGLLLIQATFGICGQVYAGSQWMTEWFVHAWTPLECGVLSTMATRTKVQNLMSLLAEYCCS